MLKRRTTRLFIWQTFRCMTGVLIIIIINQVTFTGEKNDALPVLWMAPESIERCDYSDKSEVYSLAKGCYEILCHGVYPHTGYSDLDVASVIRQVGRVYKFHTYECTFWQNDREHDICQLFVHIKLIYTLATYENQHVIKCNTYVNILGIGVFKIWICTNIYQREQISMLFFGGAYEYHRLQNLKLHFDLQG